MRNSKEGVMSAEVADKELLKIFSILTIMRELKMRELKNKTQNQRFHNAGN